MDIDYRVEWVDRKNYKVIKTTTYYTLDELGGVEQLESETKEVFNGGITECESYIRLSERGQI